MPRSSFEQTSFLGGEFGPLAQGRSDIPQYKQGMSLSLNGHPVEEGAWVKRSSFEFLVPTRNRIFGRLLPFDGSATCAFGMLFTSDNLQFITSAGSLIFDNTISTITASSYSGSGAAEITISPAQAGWAGVNDATGVLGDQVMIVFPDVSSALYPYPGNLEAGLRGRMLTIQTAIDSTHMALGNDLGRAFTADPSLQTAWPANALVGAQIMRVKNIATTYKTVQQLQNLRAVQIEYQSVILEPSTAPQVVQITTGPIQGPSGADPVFSFGALGMVDGPYFDPSGDTATLSALTGTITLTASSTTPFTLVTDVGRLVRIFTQPAAWAAGTAYTPGNLVTDAAGEWWVNVIADTGTTPGQTKLISGVLQLPWAPAPFAGSWAWGTISVVHSTSSVDIVLDTTIPGMVLHSGNGMTATSFQLGVYSKTTGFPTCGCLYQGRLLLAGAQANRFDTTVSNGVNLGTATFSPTDPYGNVTDNSGMSEVFNSRYTNNIQWMMPSPNGIVMGTLNGEFLVSASQQNDPITPTDIQSWMVTKYGAANIEPLFAGMAIMYVQKYGQKIIEYLADAFSQKYSGRHLDEWSRHLASSGVAELAYQEEPFPCLWARMNNGLLAGWTYRRFNRFVSEPPNIAAGHWHIHGRQRAITSFCVVPGKQGLIERLFCVTNDIMIGGGPGAFPPNNYFVEVMQPFFDQNQVALQGWFNDEAPGAGPGADPAYDCGGGNKALFAPSGAQIGSDTTTPNVTSTFPYDTGVPVGSDLSANLVLRGASFFDGQTMLYTLPPFPSRGSQADENAVSLSVWVAKTDAPFQAGALLSSPALSFTEANGGTQLVSNILGGPCLTADVPASMLGRTSAGIDTYPNSAGQVDDGNGIGSVSQQWAHVMISLKSNGDGTITVTAAVNETVVANGVVVGNLVNTGKAWPFLSQPGAMKDNGLSVWTLGGTEAARTTYNLASFLGTIASQNDFPFPNYTLAQWFQAYPTARLPGYQFHSLNQVRHVLPSIPQAVGFTGSGGLSNVPFSQAIGNIIGFRGSVAELWIKAGSFIDWTNSANRAVLHWHDSVSGTYKPLSLGGSGGGTALGSPWIYLSGPPQLWTLNRANGVRLATLGNGISLSPLQPPFNS